MLKKTEKVMSEIKEGAKPFYFDTGSEKVVLFIHGFVDSNGNFKNQIEKVKELGISVKGVCLPGHGTHHRDLVNYGPEDWIACAEKALLDLSKKHKEIYLVGFSIGGAIALTLAKKYPDKVTALICVGTPLRITGHNFLKIIIPIVSPFMKFRKRKIPEKFREQWLENGAYEYFPLKPTKKLIHFIEEVDKGLKKIKTPILVINIGKKNHLPYTSARVLYNKIGSKEKRYEEIPEYFTEKSKNMALNYALDFLKLNKPRKRADTILQLFLNSVADYPLKTALLCKENSRYKRLTYRELADEVFHLAYELKKLGLKRGDKVVLVSKNKPEWVVSDLAIMMAGGINVPVHEVLTGNQIKKIIDEVSAKIVIVSSKNILEKVRTAAIEREIKYISMEKTEDKGVENFEDILKAKPSDFNTIKEKLLSDLPQENDLATIVYTSGTTGHFSGVMLTHKNIVTNVLDILSVIDLDDSEKFLSILPLSHIFERTVGYYVPMAVGATISYIEDPMKLSEVAMEEKPTIIIAVPRLYEKVYDKIILEVEKNLIKKIIFNLALKIGEQANKKRDNFWKILYKQVDKIVFKKIKEKFGGRIRFFVCGGAPLPQKVGKFFYNMGILILEGYGLTETSPVISCNTDRLGCNKFGTAGKVLPSVKVKISESGEILVKGPSVTTGYFSHEKTKLAFTEDGWFKTGDLGELDKKGFLKIKGRIKEVIVLSTGKNVLPVPIEERLELCPYIKQAFVFGDEKKHIAAIFVLEKEVLKEKFPELKDFINNEKVRLLIDEELKRLQRDFAHFEQVRKYILISEPFTVENGLLTPTLKLRRHKILEKYRKEIEALYTNQ